MTKLAGTLPEGDFDGLAPLASFFIHGPDARKGRRGKLHDNEVLVLAIVSTKFLKTDVDTGDVIPTVAVRRVEPVTDDDDVTDLRMRLDTLYRARTGRQTLPFPPSDGSAPEPAEAGTGEDSNAHRETGEVRSDEELLIEAVRLIAERGSITPAPVRRKLGVGLARALRLLEALETRGVVGPEDAGRTRLVLITPEQVDPIVAGIVEEGAAAAADEPETPADPPADGDAPTDAPPPVTDPFSPGTPDEPPSTPEDGTGGSV